MVREDFKKNSRCTLKRIRGMKGRKEHTQQLRTLIDRGIRRQLERQIELLLDTYEFDPEYRPFPESKQWTNTKPFL